MTGLEITRGHKVEVPAEYQLEFGKYATGKNNIKCTHLQMVNYSLDYFTLKIEGNTDTWILEDGRQIVNGGDGWLKGHTDITSL